MRSLAMTEWNWEANLMEIWSEAAGEQVDVEVTLSQFVWMVAKGAY